MPCRQPTSSATRRISRRTSRAINRSEPTAATSQRSRKARCSRRAAGRCTSARWDPARSPRLQPAHRLRGRARAGRNGGPGRPQRAGARDPGRTVRGWVADSHILRTRGPRMVANDFRASGMARYLLKDLDFHRRGHHHTDRHGPASGATCRVRRSGGPWFRRPRHGRHQALRGGAEPTSVTDAPADTRRPNILFVLSDDHAAHTMSPRPRDCPDQTPAVARRGPASSRRCPNSAGCPGSPCSLRWLHWLSREDSLPRWRPRCHTTTTVT